VTLQRDIEGKLTAYSLLDSYIATGPWLPTLFASSVVGVAVLDSGMRFRAINGALAAMNGMPANRHIGKKLRFVLGAAARQVENATDQVVQTGESVSLELTAQLPLRTGMGHWLESFLPIPDVNGRVTRVAAVILEISERRNSERSLRKIISNLSCVTTALQAELAFHRTELNTSNGRTGTLKPAVGLVKQCIAEAQTLLEPTQLQPFIDAPQIQHPSAEKLLPLAQNGASCTYKLSPRENAILQLLANGKSNKEAAATLGISVRTEEVYRARLMKKLDLHCLAELVRFAVRHKIIEP
jgi:PAS domain S-box-containing protein